MANDCIRQKMYAHKYDSNEARSMAYLGENTVKSNLAHSNSNSPIALCLLVIYYST